jgi:tol-pal system protein YbgF
MTKLEADRDRLMERVEALEAVEQTRASGAAPKSAREQAPSDGRPPLRVVRLGADGESLAPSDEAGGGATLAEPDEDRPVVQAAGRRGAVAEKTARVDAAGAALADPKRSYEAALERVKLKQYDKAQEAFTSFLVRFPDHPYAENAMYWRGECFYAKAEFASAAEQFEGLVARFPQGNKVPDAMLKLGLCQSRLGAVDRAQKTFLQLKQRFPRSEAARQLPRVAGVP